jgi:selenophosphate synthetase-related protein
MRMEQVETREENKKQRKRTKMKTKGIVTTCKEVTMAGRMTATMMIKISVMKRGMKMTAIEIFSWEPPNQIWQ